MRLAADPGYSLLTVALLAKHYQQPIRVEIPLSAPLLKGVWTGRMVDTFKLNRPVGEGQSSRSYGS